MYRQRCNLLISGVLMLLLGMQVIFAGQPPAMGQEAFDLARFNKDIEGYFLPFYVSETKPLREVLASKIIKPDTQVLVTGIAAGKLALLTEQMAYHHVAQGISNGKPWMATF